MAAPYNLLQDKAEQALAAVIIAAASGVPDDKVFTSHNDGDETVGTHTVHIEAQGGIEDGQNSGNYRLSVVVRVSSALDLDEEGQATRPKAVHREYAGKVMDALCSTTLAADLSAAIKDFTVFDSVERRHGRQVVENRKAVTEMLLEFSAAPSDIT